MFRALGKQALCSNWKNVARKSEIRYASLASQARHAAEGNFRVDKGDKSRNIFFSGRLNMVQRIIQRTGKLPESELEKIFNPLNAKVKPTSQEILSLIKCIGEFATSEKSEVKINCLNNILSDVNKTGNKLDVSHYNALLKIYLDNEYEFSPMEFLMEMEKQNITPNRLTFFHIITACSRKGDLAGASKILEEMKKNSIPLNEHVFHALIFGHCIAKDFDGAESVINIMQNKNLPVTSLTYATYLSGIASVGDIEKFDELFKKCSNENIKFQNDHLFDIIFHLAKNGHTSKAIEMCKTNSEILDGFPSFSQKLLDNGLYDVFSVLFEIYREKNPNEVNVYENKFYRFIAEKEPIENIRKLALASKENGGCIKHFLTHVLFYTLNSKLFDKSLDIIQELRKFDQPISEFYFWPMLVDAAKNENLPKIFYLTRTIKDDFGIVLTYSLLTKFIFNNLPDHHSVNEQLIRGLSRSGTSYPFVMTAYVASCIFKDKINILLQLNNLGYINKDDLRKIAACVAQNAHVINPKAVVAFIPNVIKSALTYGHMRDTRNLNEQLSESPSENLERFISYSDARDVMDDFMLQFTKHLGQNKENFAIQLLQELVKEGPSISTEVGEQIKGKWKNPTIVTLIDELTQKQFDFTEFDKFKNLNENREDSDRQASDELGKLCLLNKVEEAEKVLKDNPDVNIASFFVFLRMLRRTNNEEKLSKYLSAYSSKLLTAKMSLNFYVFLQSELFKHGFIKEACQLMNKLEMRYNMKNELMVILRPVLEKGSLEDIQMVLDACSVQMKKFAFSEIIKYFSERYDWEKVLNLLETSDYENIYNVRLRTHVISHMVKNGNTEAIKKLIHILRNKVPTRRIDFDLIVACACVGDIETAREHLNEVATLDKKYIIKLNMDLPTNEIIRILENVINLLTGDKKFNLLILYEDLLEYYEKSNADPSKGLQLWEQIQEENNVPSMLFLTRLGRLLKRNNIDVPFDMPCDEFSNWVLQCNLPRFSMEYLLAHYQRNNYDVIENHLTNLIISGDLTTDRLKNMSNVLRKEKYEILQSKINRCIVLCNYKAALESGTLNKYVKSITTSSQPEVILNSLPHKFLCNCLINDHQRNIPEEVAKVILWAYLNQSEVDQTLSNIYGKEAKEITESRVFVEKILDIVPFVKTKNVLQFLLSQNVFDKHDLSREARFILESSYESGIGMPYPRSRFNNANRREKEAGQNDQKEDGDQDVEEEIFSASENSQIRMEKTQEKSDELSTNTVKV